MIEEFAEGACGNQGLIPGKLLGERRKRGHECLVRPVTEGKLWDISGRIVDNIAPGLNGILNRALKLSVKTRSDINRQRLRNVPKERNIPLLWKK